MKKRNRQTGEIDDIEIIEFSVPRDRVTGIVTHEDGVQCKFDYSTRTFHEEWEDYEDPKKHYEILAMGAVLEREDAEDEIFRNQEQREIGNYFETQEEAELAVRKLKAWKRLKDKGFRFNCWRSGGFGEAVISCKWDKFIDTEDMILLFGSEDE
jgi:hypothetical protein